MGAPVRESVKQAAFWLATLAVVPRLVSFWLRSFVLGRDRAFEGSSQSLSRVPGVLGQYLRRAFYARTLAHCHPSVTIAYGALLSKTGAMLDERSYIGPHAHLGLVHLERDVLVGPAVQIPSGKLTHGIGDPSTPIRDQAGTQEMVTIGAGSWIGAAAIVMADVGRESVVGAHAVVVKPIPDRVVAVGSPASVVKSRE
jgi:virginiamycin A acetyltransferase